MTKTAELASPRTETVRDKFLMAMYGQLMNDINRHLTMVWQPVAALLSTFALLSFTKEFNAAQGAVPLDYAAILIMLICTWAAAHVIDASSWYNRNLVIVANIERQFLDADDLGLIHFYFGKHRSSSKMISFLRVQFMLPAGLAIVTLGIHALTRVIPTCCDLHAPFEPARAAPYLVFVVLALFINHQRNSAAEKYAEFIALSPGKPMDGAVPPATKGHGGGGSGHALALAFRLRAVRPPGAP